MEKYFIILLTILIFTASTACSRLIPVTADAGYASSASGSDAEGAAYEEMSPEDASSEDISYENTLSEDMFSENTSPEDMSSENASSEDTSPEELLSEENTDESGSNIEFKGADGTEYSGKTNSSVTANPYDPILFVRTGDRIIYNDPSYDTCVGIDVSSHQGQIDWQQVREDGIAFAFVRVGYRGYGQEGSLVQDKYALENIDGAHDAGLLVGAYFFSQATNESEALEEASFAMSILDGRDLELPLAYDVENIRNDIARTDPLKGEEFTYNAIAFCEAVRSGGYDPMIYSNLLWEIFTFDMTKLSDYPIWYADYEGVPQTPYDFRFWQYSETGTVAGIDAYVDMDIWMRKNEMSENG